MFWVWTVWPNEEKLFDDIIAWSLLTFDDVFLTK